MRAGERGGYSDGWPEGRVDCPSAVRQCLGLARIQHSEKFCSDTSLVQGSGKQPG